MTSSHGRRIQGRRALAIMAWATLVVVAWLLWYGQHKRIIRIQAWEPAALLLSAYATFLAIFGWLLFSPGRKSAEESPGLFFAGMLTLLPPCFIAYHLMPVGSPLKPWLTIGVFVFGIIAIMSPLPDEVFAVPRDRRSYLQPLTNAYLSELDVDEPQISFQEIAPRTAYWLSRPASEAEPTGPGAARDPWADPFYGTGRQMSRIGVSQSRRSEETSRSERRRVTPSFADDPVSQSLASSTQGVQPSFGNLTPSRPPVRVPLESKRPETEPLTPPATSHSSPPRTGSVSSGSPTSQPIPLPPLRSAGSIPPVEPPSLDSMARVPLSGTAVPAAVPLPATSRRPLTEPSGRTGSPVGFQTPYQTLRTEPIPPPLPTGFPQITVPVVNLPPLSVPAAPVSPPATRVTPGPAQVAPVSAGIVAAAAPTKMPLVSQIGTNAPMPDLMRAITRTDEVPPVRESEFLPKASAGKPLPELRLSSVEPPVPPGRPAEMSLRELDRQLRADEPALADDDTEAERSLPESAALPPVVGVTRTVQQTSGDVKLERIRDEHGGEMIEGTIKVFFEVGQKRAHLHVPFSPPLAGLPEVECEPTGDDPIRLKVAVRQPYGVRIEARRAEAADALRTEISFAAVYTPSAPRG